MYFLGRHYTLIITVLQRLVTVIVQFRSIFIGILSVGQSHCKALASHCVASVHVCIQCSYNEVTFTDQFVVVSHSDSCETPLSHGQ